MGLKPSIQTNRSILTRETEGNDKGPYKYASCGRAMQVEEWRKFLKCPHCDSRLIFKRKPEAIRNIKADSF